LKEQRPDDLLTERARVDLIVAKRVEEVGKRRLEPSLVVEVKRLPVAKKIELDLRRLAAVKKTRPGSRALLFAISERHRPPMFVSKDGTPVEGRALIPETNAYYRVRHCYVAADIAHYACSIEVFLKKGVR
jgi:hypothetical protein